MNSSLDETHDPKTQSWVASANMDGCDFPIQNLPFGVFRRHGEHRAQRIGVAIGDRVLDLYALQHKGLFTDEGTRNACASSTLNELMRLGKNARLALRRRLHKILCESASEADRQTAAQHLVAQSEIDMLIPAEIGDYTDFYASIFHATNVGKLFRPDNPLLPNYKYIPIGYHGRASSLVPSGTGVVRPSGQTREGDAEPKVGPSKSLDYELELGFFISVGNALGKSISIDEADDYIFGVCLVNDWSARDIQAWEYQPLGPFLGKSFATSLSPWVVTLEALAPFRTSAFPRPNGDPQPLPYLFNANDQRSGGLDLWLEVSLLSPQMRDAGISPLTLGRSNFRDMYWTMAQMLTHHASNGCNLRPGDLLASGTVSGSDKSERGSLLELTLRGKEPVMLPTGEPRKFLEDGDEVLLTGYCERDGFRRIGLGSCRGTILPASVHPRAK